MKKPLHVNKGISLFLLQLEEFMKQHPDMGSGTRAFEQAIEKTQINIKWMNAHISVIDTWLTNQGFN